MAQWKFVKAIKENEEFKIEGLNIWNHYWHCIEKKVEVKGPDHGNPYFFKAYEIDGKGKKVEFVAGEFSDSTAGIYLKDELSEGRL